MAIAITFHGAAGTVTGSKHLLEVTHVNGEVRRLLLDCGMFQGEAVHGHRTDPNRHFGFDPRSIDAVVLSHAHIDHSGLLPRLVAEGFQGTIWSTPATRDLCAIMLEDSARIQQGDFEYEQHRARKRGRALEREGPLYTVDDVRPALERFQTTGYQQPMEVLPGITLTFTDSGHILGSAAVHLAIDDGERVLRFTFTGDVGRYVDRILPVPARIPQADVIVCESTYGDRDHPAIHEAEEELLKHVLRTCVEQKGKLIIPAFSIGKTQEILYTLNSLSNAGRLPRVPVIVDSPLAISATDIVRRHEALFRAEVREQLHNDPDLFSFRGVEFVRKVERSKQLNSRQEPCIVISASGMMEAGRVRHHLRHALPFAQNTVLAVGFCAPGTLGDALLNGANVVQIFGEPVPVKATIAHMEFYSAHADRTELVRYLNGQDRSQVRKLFLVHGVHRSLEGLRNVLTTAGFTGVEVAVKGRMYPL
ncbi:MAG: MBL fold metallo-hydrolase [Flavobacteriales bacterium]|nr:MBL fold metallo-hydrolase [Flavobacteriales bacterium]